MSNYVNVRYYTRSVYEFITIAMRKMMRAVERDDWKRANERVENRRKNCSIVPNTDRKRSMRVGLPMLYHVTCSIGGQSLLWDGYPNPNGLRSMFVTRL